ncbi:hypothetical protein CHS0354_041859 [Potamilus streckersoni]|uniref:Uncharacterized protein n=1 Tax=Potamilus streckersoni TaxID=2493646 RepID=A0AAE0ST58_9BIVA|nr:hypothetical protein CHS0354_041859 [Potamilus streckersoni]
MELESTDKPIVQTEITGDAHRKVVHFREDKRRHNKGGIIQTLHGQLNLSTGLITALPQSIATTEDSISREYTHSELLTISKRGTQAHKRGHYSQYPGTPSQTPTSTEFNVIFNNNNGKNIDNIIRCAPARFMYNQLSLYTAETSPSTITVQEHPNIFIKQRLADNLGRSQEQDWISQSQNHMCTIE